MIPKRSMERQRWRNGQVLVEFALVLPLLILLFAALVDLGALMMRHLGVQTALREAVRAAVERNLSDDTIRKVAVASSPLARLKPEDVTITRTPGNPAAPGGSGLRTTGLLIEIASRHEYMLPFIMDGTNGTRVTGRIRAVLVER